MSRAYGMSAALRGALQGVLALQDTHGGVLLYTKNFYGLELLTNHF